MTTNQKYVDLLQEEVKRLSSISTYFQNLIKEAKTSYKKKYYTKKLKKNNKILMDMLIRLNQITPTEKNNDVDARTDEE